MLNDDFKNGARRHTAANSIITVDFCRRGRVLPRNRLLSEQWKASWEVMWPVNNTQTKKTQKTSMWKSL